MNELLSSTIIQKEITANSLETESSIFSKKLKKKRPFNLSNSSDKKLSLPCSSASLKKGKINSRTKFKVFSCSLLKLPNLQDEYKPLFEGPSSILPTTTSITDSAEISIAQNTPLSKRPQKRSLNEKLSELEATKQV